VLGRFDRGSGGARPDRLPGSFAHYDQIRDVFAGTPKPESAASRSAGRDRPHPGGDRPAGHRRRAVFGPGGGETVTYFDSEYRFLNVVWLAVGVGLLWSLRKPGQRAVFTRAILLTLIGGGLARLVSVAAVGLPPGIFAGSLLVELIVIPALLIWHVRALRPQPGKPVPTF
jgi:Domain of unknown function (DUF4345)